MIPVHSGVSEEGWGQAQSPQRALSTDSRLAMEALALIDRTDSAALFHALEAPVMFRRWVWPQ